MKAILIREHGDLDQVRFEEIDEPEVKAGQVLVRTQAAALNHLDLWVLRGIPGLRLQMPHVLGSDGAGVVQKIGEGVTGWAPGDGVMLNPGLWCGRCEFCIRGEQSLCLDFGLVGEHRAGTYAEYFVVAEANLEKIPEGVSFAEAAAFSLVYQTAWRMLVARARIQPGEDVFIHGMGSGVATAALQIVKLCGGRAFVSSSSEEKLERARRLGADFCYDYARSDVVGEVLRETAKRGVDIVVEHPGASTWLQSLKMVRKGGRIVTCGATTGANPQTEIRYIFWKQIEILGSTMSNCREYHEVVRLLGQGKLKPVIDKSFPLAEGKKALEYLRDGRQFGKIVLTDFSPPRRSA